MTHVTHGKLLSQKSHTGDTVLPPAERKGRKIGTLLPTSALGRELAAAGVCVRVCVQQLI